VAAAAKDDSVTSVARRFGVSRQRAYQLLQDEKTREAPSPGTKRAKKPQEGKKT
jgi:transposase-like protein